jgi:hypothetical protein
MTAIVEKGAFRNVVSRRGDSEELPQFNGCISYMVSMVAGWIAKIGQVAMNFKTFSLQTLLVWTNQVHEPGMGIFVDRVHRQRRVQQCYLGAWPRAAKTV